MKESDLEWLHKIANFEDTHDMSEFKIGWTHRHVGIQGTIFEQSFLERLPR